jgi:hypothetical protein
MHYIGALIHDLRINQPKLGQKAPAAGPLCCSNEFQSLISGN